jgi:hypothetical protein
MDTTPPFLDQNSDPAQDKAPDFSHYLDASPNAPNPGKATSAPVRATFFRRFSARQIIAGVLIIALAGVLAWLVLSGGRNQGAFKVPIGYRLVSPDNGPPRLQKTK